MNSNSAPRIFTIGHSTRTLEDFIGLLQAHGVTLVADVRTIPRSRHTPQFNRETLPDNLLTNRIDYVHVPQLGGLRKSIPGSVNMGWQNASFRGYADYMQTPEFNQALTDLIPLTEKAQTALMCAEAVPWRCHRSLIADALLVRGIVCEHIMSATYRQEHKLTPFAKVHGRHLTYPAP